MYECACRLWTYKSRKGTRLWILELDGQLVQFQQSLVKALLHIESCLHCYQSCSPGLNRRFLQKQNVIIIIYIYMKIGEEQSLISPSHFLEMQLRIFNSHRLIRKASGQYFSSPSDLITTVFEGQHAFIVIFELAAWHALANAAKITKLTEHPYWWQFC